MRRSSRRKEQISLNLPLELNNKKHHSNPKKEIRSLVVIEQTKVRKKYIQGCKRTIKDLDKAKKEWEEFSSVDVPKYDQWLNVNFGNEISRIREANEKARELNSTLEEIRFWVVKKGISPYEAYILVKDRKANPEKYRTKEEAEAEREREAEENWNKRHGKNFFDEDDLGDDDFDSDEEEPSEEELKMMFDFFIQSNPSLKSKMKLKGFYEFMYEKFKEDVLGKKSTKSAKSEDNQESGEDRIKSIYRILVRKLHPDFQTTTSEHLTELWHEVQSAYKSKDLERLETILAISNIQTGDFSEEISVSQILNVQSEYKSQLKSIRAQIRKARKQVQWGFSKLTNLNPLSKKIKVELNEELSNHQYHIREFENQLKAWSKPMVKVSRNRYVYI